MTYTGELAAIIGRRCKNVVPDDIGYIVHGYTIISDLDALDQHRRIAHKSFDGLAPLGPRIDRRFDPPFLEMQTEIRDEICQSSSISSMLFGPAEAISFITERLTLKEDDAVAIECPGSPGVIELATRSRCGMKEFEGYAIQSSNRSRRHYVRGCRGSTSL